MWQNNIKYIKYSFTTLLFLIVSISLKAQNEWINYNQTYYKFFITQKGIYRISKANLLNNGINAGSINPKNIKIYHNGNEIPIYVKGENDLIFNDNDYIEFYAEPNDGFFDKKLYNQPSQQTNPYVSLINDTATYFLTVQNDNSPKLRYTIIDDTNSTSYAIINTGVSQNIYSYAGHYYTGQNIATYIQGEGWFDASTYYNNHYIEKHISLQNPVINTPAQIELCFVGTPASDVISAATHHTTVYLNNTQIIDTLFYGYNFVRKTINFLSANNYTFRFIADYNSSIIDRQAVSYIKISYKRNLNFDNQQETNFIIPAHTDTLTVTISDFDGGNTPIILDYKNGQKYTPIHTSTNEYKFVLPPTNYGHHIYIANTSAIHQITHIEQAPMTNYFNTLNYDLIFITNKKLWTSATEYKNYREQQGYNVLLVDVEQLYDEFAYGIKKHPLAIKNFLQKIYYTYDTLPKAVFLIGKSIHNYLSKSNPDYYKENLVPTFGDPSSDNLYTTQLDTSTTNIYYPQIPIGRLAANTNEEVITYLQKVKEYESAPKSEWMKHVLHLGGGITQSQQQTFASYLNQYKTIIEDTLFGGHVYTFIKNSSLPISSSAYDSIKSIIDSGITLLTFFGHGSSSGFDQSIDFPNSYNNSGKYPFIISNSCLTGDIHLPPPQRIPEQWVLAQEKGAIAFEASSDIAYPSALHAYSTELYKQISYYNYGHPIGQQIQKSLYNISQGTTNPYTIKTVLDLTLHGDPLITLNYFTKPDLLIHSNEISFTPSIITNITDTFNLNFVVTNEGRAFTDTFITQISRTINDTTYQIPLLINGCFYKDTISIKLPSTPNNQAGENRICLYADQINQIDEYNEQNNQTCINFYVYNNFIYPVWPYKYAIYPYDTVTLKACSGSPFNFSDTIIFQIDTTDYYNSPMLHQHITYLSPGGVAYYTLPFNLSDSTVYYWRVGKSDGYSWKESSFIYIKNKHGWSQAHFFQFKKDKYKFISYNRPERKFDYTQAPISLFCRDIGTPSTSDFQNIKYYIGENGDYSCCGPADAIIVAIVDHSFLQPWTSDKQNYGQRNYPQCPSRNRPDKYFVFSTDSVSLADMATMLIDSINQGDYILIYSWKNGHFQEWPEIAYQALEMLGDNNIRLTPDNHPYIYFTQKGNSSISERVIGNTTTDTITLNYTIPQTFYYGTIKSTPIGPASNISSLHWRYKDLSYPHSDTTSLTFSQTISNNDSILWQTASVFDTIFPLQNDFSYYTFKLFTADTSNRTPSQLKRWQVIYDEAPETAINPPKGFYFPKDSIQQGDTLIFSVTTENISQKDMDSLVVRYYITGNDNITHIVKEKKLRPHPSGDILSDTLFLNTSLLLGEYTLKVEYNPINSQTGTYYQPEQYHFNNIAETHFYVYPDKTNPLLDVTFDGRHILDYETVSAHPNIKISLTDDNNFFLLNDTSLFEIYLYPLKSDTIIRIWFKSPEGNDIINFYPATNYLSNKCIALYSPKLSDGTYILEVYAKDKSGNLSGLEPYKIHFTVKNEAGISNFYCYPNPFKNKTYFAFSLTGTQIPDEFYINIYSISGKFIKKINLTEQYPVYIGQNITNVYWDGTNTRNQKVPSGVYIYKPIAKINGQKIPLILSNPKIKTINGYGKIIYIK